MNTIREEDRGVFEKSEKLGVVATLEETGDPHLTLLTTIMAKSDTEMVVGQFTKGTSKQNMRERRKCGFLIMDLNKCYWTGTMDWKGLATEGEEFVRYNNMPMWRFNTYFGIDVVHYFDLREISEKRKLEIPKIAVNEIRAVLRKPFAKGKKTEKILRPYAADLINGFGNPKFISFTDEEGYPVVVPAVQAQEAGRNAVVLPAAPLKKELSALKKGARVAFMAVSMEMESVVVKGAFDGFKGGVGRIGIDKVYNSIPPLSRYIYPFDDFTEAKI